MAATTDPSADWFSQQMNTETQPQQAGGSYQQVATAPDGVPVYSSGGQYFTKNGDGSYTQQFQGGAPSWLTQQTGGQTSSGGGMPAPGSDVMQALTQFYQSQGKTPGAPGSGPTDIAYMAQKIQQTGGMTPQNIAYWFGPGQYGQNGRIGGELAGTVPPESGGNPGTLANPQVPQAGQNLQNTSSVAPYQAPAPYTPQQIQQPGAVNAQQVTPSPVGQPGTITPQTVQGPQALTAQTLANPTGFQAPTQADLQNNPQFQYAQQQAMQALVNSGAAQGVARDSNEWKALQQQASDLAGQQYQQMYNNSLNQYQTNTTNTLNYNQANQGNQAQAYGLTNQYQQQAALANQGVNYNAQAQNIGNQMQTGQFNAGQNLAAQQANQGANLNAGQFNAGMNYNTQAANIANAGNAYQTNATTGLNAYNANVANATGQQQLGLGYQQAANTLALGQGNLGLGYANYGLNQQGQNYNQGLSTYNANQNANQQLFNNNYSLAQLGLTANGQIGQQGNNYANAAGNAYEGIGNAQAAGSQQQGQNIGGTIGNIGNYASQLALYNARPPTPQGQTQTTPYTLGY
jgi:hypothetical protein